MADAVWKIERCTSVHIYLTTWGDNLVEGNMADTADVYLVEMMHDMSYRLILIVEKFAKLQNHFRIGKFLHFFYSICKKRSIFAITKFYILKSKV